MPKTVLILGPTGRFGSQAASAFEAAGWTVRRYDRQSGDLARAAWGAEIIVNAWNPPYPDWAAQVPILTESVIKVALQTSARVIIPGNVYNFGAQTPLPWSADSDQAATNGLGRIRTRMEARYAAAGVRTIVLRAGDFIDTRASGNWFDMVLTRNIAKGILVYPGNPDIPHAWAYLPDMVRATVLLADQSDSLPDFLDLPFPGYTLTGRDLHAGLERATGQNLKLKMFSYLQLHLARPFWRMARHLIEMRYLWETPHMLEGTRFRQTLPGFRDTPLEVALAAALGGHSVQPQINPDQTVPAGA